MTDGAPWYRLIDHTGDIAILVRAATRGELFDAAARALFDVILDVSTVETRLEVAVAIEEAMDAEDLLVRFLGELLFLHDARDFVFGGFRIDALTETSVSGAALGERFDPARHVVRRQVKAVTYHHLLVSEDRDGWSARLVLDL